MRTPVGVAVVGTSPRGAALARTFEELPQADLRWICDEAAVRSRTPGETRPRHTPDFDELLEDEQVDVIVFAATQLSAHGRARAALEADKHVFIDGPLAFTSPEADALVELASRRSRRLWSHLAGVQRPAARTLHTMVDRGVLGEIFYLHVHQYVERDDTLDLLWGPGADAVSLMLDLLADEPIEAVARADSYLGRATPDVLFAELRFATGIAAHLHLSCLEGETVERFSVVASEATAILSDERGRELVLYPGGECVPPFTGVSLDRGSMIAYRVPPEDSLRTACARFLGTVRSPGDAQHGREAAAAVAVLEALERSCQVQGVPETITPRAVLGGFNVVELRSR